MNDENKKRKETNKKTKGKIKGTKYIKDDHTRIAGTNKGITQ
jgi:hypothetical protein